MIVRISVEFAEDLGIVPKPIACRPRWTWAHFFRQRNYGAELREHLAEYRAEKRAIRARYCIPGSRELVETTDEEVERRMARGNDAAT